MSSSSTHPSFAEVTHKWCFLSSFKSIASLFINSGSLTASPLLLSQSSCPPAPAPYTLLTLHLCISLSHPLAPR